MALLTAKGQRAATQLNKYSLGRKSHNEGVKVLWKENAAVNSAERSKLRHQSELLIVDRVRADNPDALTRS